MFEVRAWETSFGSTIEEAVANPNPQGGRLALAGESGIMSVLTGDPTLAEPTPPTSLVQDDARVVPVVGPGLRDGFVLDVVPEPSPLVLSLLFCSLFLLVRHGQAGGRSRRRRSNSCRCSQ